MNQRFYKRTYRGQESLASVDTQRHLQPFVGWHRSFFIAPIGLALFMAMVVKIVARNLHVAQQLNIGWAVGCPFGFVLWLALWENVGPGGGELSPAILIAACFGWFMWCYGLLLASRRSMQQPGIVVAGSILVFWLALVAFVPQGTGILEMELLCASTLVAAHLVRMGIRKYRTLREQLMTRGIVFLPDENASGV